MGLARNYAAHQLSGWTTMALLHLHHDDVSGLARNRHFSISRAFKRISAAFAALHRAIVDAKLHHAESDLLFRHDYSEVLSSGSEPDVREFPQRPLILGDKWDF
jgi:hypothetical protein